MDTAMAPAQLESVAVPLLGRETDASTVSSLLINNRPVGVLTVVLGCFPLQHSQQIPLTVHGSRHCGTAMRRV